MDYSNTAADLAFQDYCDDNAARVQQEHIAADIAFHEKLKETNPKDAVGVRKVPLHVVPARVTAEVGLALLEGARKYGSYNWRAAGVRASVYFDATRRHMDDWWEGVDIDPDSGLSHVTKAIASLTVLRDSMMHGNWQDDRPIRAAAGWVQDMNGKAAAIIDRYPDAKAPFTAVRAALEEAHPLIVVEAKKPQGKIFLDMDGVLADFDAGARKALNTDNTYQWEFQHGQKAFWGVLDAVPDFFGSLPPMPDMELLWNAVKHLDPIVLTALPRTGADEVDKQKRQWVHDKLGPHVRVITCQTFEKPQYCDFGDVLVDDRTVNRAAWEEAGGILLHHTSAADTVKTLKALNYI
ncbi:5' nucleotidase [Sinorhizobium phage phiM5]|nr:5' nucleotidase [Sinorhizobium phage phiM5]